MYDQYFGAYLQILLKYSGNDDYLIEPQHVPSPEYTGLPSRDDNDLDPISFLISALPQENPVLSFDIRCLAISNLHPNLPLMERVKLDKRLSRSVTYQYVQRFRYLRPKAITPRVHAITALGPLITFHNPHPVMEEQLEWFDVRDEEAYTRFVAVVNDIKQMMAGQLYVFLLSSSRLTTFSYRLWSSGAGWEHDS